MKRTMILGVMVAIGSLVATSARAQDDTAGDAPTATEKQSATSDPAAYGAVVGEPATVDANGMPVAKPNPLSDFLKRSRQQGTTEVEVPLVDDPRADGSATDGQTN